MFNIPVSVSFCYNNKYSSFPWFSTTTAKPFSLNSHYTRAEHQLQLCSILLGSSELHMSSLSSTCGEGGAPAWDILSSWQIIETFETKHTIQANYCSFSVVLYLICSHSLGQSKSLTSSDIEARVHIQSI